MRGDATAIYLSLLTYNKLEEMLIYRVTIVITQYFKFSERSVRRLLPLLLQLLHTFMCFLRGRHWHDLSLKRLCLYNFDGNLLGPRSKR